MLICCLKLGKCLNFSAKGDFTWDRVETYFDVRITTKFRQYKDVLDLNLQHYFMYQKERENAAN